MGTVLIVEDNDKNMKLARDVLQAKGYATLEAVTGEEGVRLAREKLPDLVLMDIAMPGMDGLELTQRLKARPEFARVPIVALSAFAMKGDEAKALAAGCDGYITKPINTRTFVAQVMAYLPGT